MKMSKFQEDKKRQLKKKAVTLYKQGLSMRDVAKIVKMSHQWVHFVIRDLSTGKTLQD